MIWTECRKECFKTLFLLSLILFIVPSLRSSATVDASAEEYLLNKVNEERKRRNLETLKMDEDLRNMARKYSFKMSETDRIKHTTKGGITPEYRLCKSRIHLLKYAENLAKSSSPAGVHQSFMNSEEHRNNILNPDYTHVGIGVVKKGNAYYVTQELIKPLEIRSVEKIRKQLSSRLNRLRQKEGLSPLNYSEDLEEYLESNPPGWSYKNNIHAVELPSELTDSQRYATIAFTGSNPDKIPDKLVNESLRNYDNIGIAVRLGCLPHSPYWKYKFSVGLTRSSPEKK